MHSLHVEGTHEGHEATQARRAQGGSARTAGVKQQLWGINMELLQKRTTWIHTRVGLAETERTTYKTKDKIVPTSSRLASPRLGLAVVVEALVVRDLGGPLPGGDVEGRHERLERLGPAQLVLDRVQDGRGLRL